MTPTSLIFVVLLGVWAAYFAQYWIRRREHLATLHSVDALSETMRVLGRRQALPTTADRPGGPRVHPVVPARQPRPQVAARVGSVEVDADAPPVATSPRAAPRDAAPVRAAQNRTGSGLGVSGKAGSGPVGSGKVGSARRSRGTRGVVFLTCALGTIVFAVLSAVGVLRGWAFLVPAVMALGSWVWVRAGVRAEQRARREMRRRARRVQEHFVAGVHAAESANGQDDPQLVEATTGQPELAEPELTESGLAEPELAEPLVAGPEQPARPEQPELDEDDMPLTWDPRPVPRPTYTMKARAADRFVDESVDAEMPPALESEGSEGKRRAYGEGEHTAYDDVPQRRIAGA